MRAQVDQDVWTSQFICCMECQFQKERSKDKQKKGIKKGFESIKEAHRVIAEIHAQLIWTQWGAAL